MTNRYKNFIPTLYGFAIFNPKGPIAHQERDLMVIAIGLMLFVVIPVLIATFMIAWKYRAGHKSKYTPTVDRDTPLQLTWVAVLSVIVCLLATLAWTGAHDLDPRKALESNVKPITIQVVALDWKWLFIYPDLNIATVNLVQFPVNTPINFEITADAPMNSFWIPELGGQMYAMSGMKTQLHLMADEQGTYTGQSSNISGEGFAGMTFQAVASSQADFKAWVETAKFYGNNLDVSGYEQLARPSQNNQVAYFRPQADLFNSIVMKFMPASPAGGPEKNHEHTR